MRFEINVDKEKHDLFVKQHPLCNLLQSSSWAKVKENWDSQIVGVYENDELIASALVLMKRLPLNITMMYIPRGPIMDYGNANLVKFFFSELKKWAKKYHCLFIKFDPAILYHSFFLDQEKVEAVGFKQQFSNIQSIGAVHKGFNQDFETTVQPRFHMVEYKDSFGLDFLSKKGKKNLKIAEKKKMDIKFGHLELLDDFCEVMKSTEERKNISLRNKEYFRLLLDTYQKDAFIGVAYVNIEEEYNEILDRYEQCIKELEECPENAKKKRFTLEELKVSLERQKKMLKEELETHGKRVCVCGTLTVVYGKTSEILYAGMNDTFKRYMAPYLTWFKTMEKCFDQGCTWSNMGGIEGTLQGGLVDFKSVYNPKINEFIGEFDLPVNKFLYRLSQMAYQIRKKRNKKK